MTYRELRRSDLLDALFALEREEDINRVSRYFRSALRAARDMCCAASRMDSSAGHTPACSNRGGVQACAGHSCLLCQGWRGSRSGSCLLVLISSDGCGLWLSVA
jgi:hypothetical protein